MSLPEYIKITDEQLKKSANTYRKELLMMPVTGAMATLQHMSGRPNIAGKETVTQLSGGVELAPYDPTRIENAELEIKIRELETFLGSVVKRFDVNQLSKTIYGEAFAQGMELTQANIARQVLVYLSAKLGESLNNAVFAGKRNAQGKTTKDLFDGFDTITQKEIDGNEISEGNKNLFTFQEQITNVNAHDLLTQFYLAADDHLKEVQTKLYVPRSILEAYQQDYATTRGATPYNTKYEQTILEASNGLCEIVPLASKKGSSFIHLSTKGNMLYGYGAGMADENLAIEKHHEFLLSYVATMYFGVQFETISPERLLVGKLA